MSLNNSETYSCLANGIASGQGRGAGREQSIQRHGWCPRTAFLFCTCMHRKSKTHGPAQQGPAVLPLCPRFTCVHTCDGTKRDPRPRCWATGIRANLRSDTDGFGWKQQTKSFAASRMRDSYQIVVTALSVETTTRLTSQNQRLVDIDSAIDVVVA